MVLRTVPSVEISLQRTVKTGSQEFREVTSCSQNAFHTKEEESSFLATQWGVPNERLAAAREAFLSHVHTSSSSQSTHQEVPAGGFKVVFLSVSCHFLDLQDE